MIISHQLRRLSPTLKNKLLQKNLYLGVSGRNILKKKLLKAGFSNQFENGECVIPTPVFGRFSKFNSLGKDIVRRDLPKESFSYEVLWTREQYCGRDETEEVTDLVTHHRMRYPRKHIDAPCEELTLIYKEEELYILSRPISAENESTDNILHIINLIVEIFGYCDIFDSELNSVITKAKIRKVRWKILPVGKKSWEEIREDLENNLQNHVPKPRKNVLIERLRLFNSYRPDEMVLGLGGFNGYCILLYKEKDLAIFESPWTGNATYIFSISEWENASKKTKKEILDSDQAIARIIHKNESWSKNIEGIFKVQNKLYT